MKLKILLTTAILLLVTITYGQQAFCADSSFRIRYVFGNDGATLHNTPDTSGQNIFTGNFQLGQIGGIALLKTNWGDSMIWAKKITLNGYILSTTASSDGSIIGTGAWGGVSSVAELLISKIDTNGAVQWIKHFGFNQTITSGNFGYKNILVTNNSIYFNIVFNGLYSIVAKLDLNGNIIWSRGFWMNNLPANTALLGTPAYNSNTILIYGTSGYTATSAGVTTFTKLNDADGSFLESFAYRTLPDATIKGSFPSTLKYNTDNSFTLTGIAAIDVFGIIVPSGMMFNTLLDANLNPVHNYYYKNVLLTPSFDIDFNNQKQHAFLGFASNSYYEKYFVTFGKNDEVLRSRKFTIPSFFSNLNVASVNLDDKQNIHFVFQYDQGTKLVTEYARISNFAPNGTPGCFGKDTSILTQTPFTIIKEPFVWDNTASNVIVSNDVPYTEDTAIVTKELVCKIVSRCDSVHIKGPVAACIGQPVRYTVSKNSGCFKNSDWLIDTSFATIVNTEGDSAITIRFTKAFTGYIHAAISDCVVKDSFFVTVLPSPLVKITNRDSLLCPGKKIVLKAKPGFINYLWQDGSTADSLQVTTAGFYKVTGTDSCGFKTADSIAVNNSDTSLILPATQTICKYDTAYITLPNDVNNITWQPFINTLLNNKTLKAYPIQNTIYTITAERQANCPITKTSTVVIKNCTEIVFIPNAFTPNNDSRNDIFKASTFRALQFYQMVIYNRYGQKIFETTNLSAGWDGNFKGSKQPTGGYTYRCSYRFAGGLQRTEAGYFILIR